MAKKLSKVLLYLIVILGAITMLIPFSMDDFDIAENRTGNNRRSTNLDSKGLAVEQLC